LRSRAKDASITEPSQNAARRPLLCELVTATDVIGHHLTHHEVRRSSLLPELNERRGALSPWQNLNFLPLPHGQGA
jgi:hypothetical protein